MCTSSWPQFLDLSRDECKRILRRLELEAYSSVISVFRSQGDLSKEKKKVLLELQHMLSVSTERHRAEVRRAVNDEKLSTIADNMAGPDISSEWQIEGRRLVPLMPRLVPQTAFTVTANGVANAQAEKNLSLPSPSQTAFKEVPPVSTPAPSTTPVTSKASRPVSPGSNVVVLPSGMSIHIRGGLSADEEEVQMKSRRRSSSNEGVIISRATPVISTTTPAKSSLVSTPTGPAASPMKITVGKSPVKPQSSSGMQPSAQKVIIVSSTTMSSTPSSAVLASSGAQTMLHHSVPMVKAGSLNTLASTAGTMLTTTPTSQHPRSSFVLPNSAAPNGNLGNIITVATSAGQAGSTPQQTASSMVGQIQIPSVGMGQPRTRVRTITTRPRMPQSGIGVRSGLMIPVGSQSMASPTQGMHNIQVRPVTKPTIHIKQEGSMKIITQGMPSAGSKILPKPMTTGGTSVVVVPTTPSSITMVSKSVASGAVAQVTGGKVLNISSASRQTGTTTTRPIGTNVVTVNPKTLQLTTIKGTPAATLLTGGRLTTPSGGKPNVIVVQKTQARRPSQGGQGPSTPLLQVTRVPTSGATNSPFEKEMISFLQKQDVHHRHLLAQPVKVTGDKRNIRPGFTEIPRRSIVVRQKPDGSTASQIINVSGGQSGSGSIKPSLLAELIQAVGLSSDNITISEQEVITEENRPAVSIAQTEGTKEGSSSSSQHQWVDFDVHQHQQQQQQQQQQQKLGDTVTPRTLQQQQEVVTSQDRGVTIHRLTAAGGDATDASAIKALLDLGQSKQQRPTTLDVGPGSAQEQESDEVTVLESAVLEAQSQVQGSADQDIEYIGTTLPATGRPPSHIQVYDKSGTAIQVQIARADDLLRLVTSATTSSIQGVPFVTTSAAAAPSSLVEDEAAHNTTIINPDAIVIANEGKKEMVIRKPSAESQPQPRDSAAHKQLDFLSSALTQAQIDLDSYSFMEEESGNVVHHPHDSSGSGPGPSTTQTQTVLVTEDGKVIGDIGGATSSISAGGSTNPQSTLVSILNPMRSAAPSVGEDQQGSVSAESGTILGIPHRVLSKDRPKPTPGRTSEIITMVTPSGQVITTTTPVGRPKASVVTVRESQLERAREEGTIIHVVQQPKPQQQQQQQQQQPQPQPHQEISSSQVQSVVTASSTVAVAAEAGEIDPLHMKLEDFTSQRLDGDDEGLYSLSTGQGGQFLEGAGDGSTSPRLSKRKRKAPHTPDEISSPSSSPTWTRHALNLLHKIMRFRGAHKEKGEMNAASWFTHPVNPAEVPDYYQIIETPMDFSTIKKKLEAQQYDDWDEYNVDMLKIRNNCWQYNQQGTEVRRDCDEVFTYYVQEYERTITRWQQFPTMSPVAKKPRVDRSPIRP